MDASDEVVVGTGNPLSNSADSASVLAGTSQDPIALSDGSASSPEPEQNDDVELAPGSERGISVISSQETSFSGFRI
ncbi:hypothetical protein JG688_00014681 [Phytophthora aleatoria]|uniref:Uncharacterized protein n=1 Tax=Phytophthora aleatoria TaxID=2496075 RepID=A0A8J5IKV4_9STRA|nr:hypothetical protein JG688_00014681 [Phytophthora aleatoria]